MWITLWRKSVIFFISALLFSKKRQVFHILPSGRKIQASDKVELYFSVICRILSHFPSDFTFLRKSLKASELWLFCFVNITNTFSAFCRPSRSFSPATWGWTQTFERLFCPLQSYPLPRRAYLPHGESALRHHRKCGRICSSLPYGSPYLSLPQRWVCLCLLPQTSACHPFSISGAAFYRG